MKVAIITDENPSVRNPMGQSLNKMLSKIGITSEVFDDSNIQTFPLSRIKKYSIYTKNIIKLIANKFYKKGFKIKDIINTINFIERLENFDAIFVVSHIPWSLSRKSHTYIEEIRRRYTIPIISYDLHFWGTMGNWYIDAQNDPLYGGMTSMDRFDYYAVVSITNIVKLNSAVDWPVAVIGGNFQNSDLFPNQNGRFKALLDFQRIENTEERNLQIEVLTELNIPFTALDGKYSYSDICKIYSEHSIYFLASQESFGLPIVELQNCGCYIFTPYRSWPLAHYINKSVYEHGEGELGENFIVYENDKNILKNQILAIKEKYEANVVLNNFTKNYPQLRHGNLETLAELMAKIDVGKINHTTHLEYSGLEHQILSDQIFWNRHSPASN